MNGAAAPRRFGLRALYVLRKPRCSAERARSCRRYGGREETELSARSFNRARLGVMMSLLIGGSVLLGGVAEKAEPAPSRINFYCSAFSQTPQMDGSTKARARGGVSCSSQRTFQHILHLYNNSGNSLGDTGLQEYTTNYVNVLGQAYTCTGAVVKSFSYSNEAGNGTSHTSDTISNCAY